MKTKTATQRKIWLTLHGWLGAIAAAFLLVVSLTGSSLVFIEEMVELQVGDPASASADGEWQRPDVLINQATNYAGPGFAPIHVYYPDSLIRIESAFVYGTGGRYARSPDDQILVFLDVVEGRALAAWRLDNLWADTFLHLHYQLLADATGAIVIAICGIALLISAITGVYLWWPRGRLSAKLKMPKWNGNLRKVLFDFHGFTGIYFAILISILAFSGTQLSQPSWFSAIIPADLQALPAEVTPRLRACDDHQPSPTEIGQAIDSFPDRRPSYYALASGDQPALLRMKASSDVDALYGDIYIWLDCSGHSFVKDVGAEDPGTVTALAQYSIHSGRIGGSIGRLLVFLSGLALALLAGSGLYLFLKTRLRRWARFGGSRDFKGDPA